MRPDATPRFIQVRDEIVNIAHIRKFKLKGDQLEVSIPEGSGEHVVFINAPESQSVYAALQDYILR